MQAALYFNRKRRRRRIQDQALALQLQTLTQDDSSTAIAVNPVRVTAFYPRTEGGSITRVHLVDGPIWDINQTYATIKALFSAQGFKEFSRAGGVDSISLNPNWVSSVEDFVSSTDQCVVWMVDEERYQVDQTFTNTVTTLQA